LWKKRNVCENKVQQTAPEEGDGKEKAGPGKEKELGRKTVPTIRAFAVSMVVL